MTTVPKVLNLNETSAEAAAACARQALKSGGIVAFPTETVYGLAILGNEKAPRDRLFHIKQRDPNQHLARYVSISEDVNLIPGISVNLRAKRLMRAFWPGPLTVILETDSGATEGFRLSSHPVAALMASDKKIPMLGTSANISGQAPLKNAQEIRKTFGDKLALIIDQGKELPGRASSVVQTPRRGGFQILREGEVDRELITSEMSIKICIVCTGNTCRSPLAQAILTDLLHKRDVKGAQKARYTVTSAGTAAARGLSASRHSQTIAENWGLSLEHHQSRPITEQDLLENDLILTMTWRHRDMLLDVLPECENRIRTLAGGDRDVVDPFGGDLGTYMACANDMRGHLTAILEDL